MKFYSTNRKAPECDFVTALFTGQAPDRGLYMPSPIPSIAKSEWEKYKTASYPEMACWILGKFMGDLISKEHLYSLCQEAYSFEVPIEQVSKTRFLLRLDRGPTASFKDFAARMMARLMSYFRSQGDSKLVVLTATSGDTGSAVAHAFLNMPQIDVIVLFPVNEVSERQRRQMTTLNQNITTIAVDGKFDHCQALVKQAFADPELRSIRLTSANSINIGRLLPQIVYYVYAYFRIAQYPEPVVFSIPSGNFGNMMGALLAKRMGLPISRIVVATNANDEVPKYLQTGVYQKIEPSRMCISNAMNVGHPSNFARVIDLYHGHMDEKGNILIQPDLDQMRRELFAVSISDEETRKTIQQAWEKDRVLLEPHGAVAWAGLEKYLQETQDVSKSISVETAHPAKFPEEIQALLGFTPDMPPCLQGLEEKKEYPISMRPEYHAFRAFLWDRYKH